MSEVVNLRQARKAKRRAEADGAAAANRLRFGRTLAEREGEAKEAARSARSLDGARLDGAGLKEVGPGGEVRRADPSDGTDG